MRWIVDTSAWGRRAEPAVGAQLAAILQEEDGNVLVMSPTVAIELLRGPKDEAVHAYRRELEADFDVLSVDTATFGFAFDAMEVLALVSPEAHRLPVADLVTAALAHQHGCGVVHIDADFALLAASSGLRFTERRLTLPGAPTGTANPAERQRELRKELHSLLAARPIAEAEALLESFVAQLAD